MGDPRPNVGVKGAGGGGGDLHENVYKNYFLVVPDTRGDGYLSAAFRRMKKDYF